MSKHATLGLVPAQRLPGVQSAIRLSLQLDFQRWSNEYTSHSGGNRAIGLWAGLHRVFLMQTSKGSRVVETSASVIS